MSNCGAVGSPCGRSPHHDQIRRLSSWDERLQQLFRPKLQSWVAEIVIIDFSPARLRV